MASGLKAGTLLHHGMYRIEKILGAGGFGITYLAMDLGLGRLRAIKEFFPKNFCERNETTSHVTLGTSATEEFVGKLKKKFLKEARNIARLEHHPGIVTIHSVFEENNTAYYVMDYIEGESLSQIVKREGPLPVEKAIKYITEVGNALEYVHKHHINHLDIKPANIMIHRQDDSAILIDFGLSKQYDSEGSETTTTPTGTSKGFTPKEQYIDGGVREFSPQTDIYALAATLYYLITGTIPPHALELNDISKLSFPTNLPEFLISGIKKGMQYEKDNRHETVKAFFASLKPEDEVTVIENPHRNGGLPTSDNNKSGGLPASDNTHEKTSVSNGTKKNGKKRQNRKYNFPAYCKKHKNSIVGFCLAVVVITGGVLVAVFTSGDDSSSGRRNIELKEETSQLFYNDENSDLHYSILDGSTGTAVLKRADSNIKGNVVIPEKTVIEGKTYTVTSIGEGAFEGCIELTSVTIPNSVTTIDFEAFFDCTSLKSIRIPDSVTEIKNNAFGYCSGLTSITIPASVASIGPYTFAHCNSLTNFIVNPDNPFYQSIDGVLYSKDMKKLIRCPLKEKGEFIIPSSVTEIGQDAFGNCKGLKKIKIADSVTSIEDNAFDGCEGLESITIPKSVKRIGYTAFENCSHLHSIWIINYNIEIMDGAFRGCKNLKNIDIPARFLDADGKIKSEYM